MFYTHQSNNASPSKHPATECYFERISLEINFQWNELFEVIIPEILHDFGITHNTFTVLNSEDFYFCLLLFFYTTVLATVFLLSLKGKEEKRDLVIERDPGSLSQTK